MKLIWACSFINFSAVLEAHVILVSSNHQEYSQSLVSILGTINLFPEYGKKLTFEKWKMKENHNIKSKSTQNLYNKNVWHVNITKPIIFRVFIHLTSVVVVILVKLFCFTSPFVTKLDAKSVVPELTTRDSEHSWWSLLTAHAPSKCESCICQLCTYIHTHYFLSLW